MLNCLKADFDKSGLVADKLLDELDQETKIVSRTKKKFKKTRNKTNNTSKQKIGDDSDGKKLSQEEFELNKSDERQQSPSEEIEKEKQSDESSNKNG